MSKGYYRMERGWMDNPVFKDESFTDREAWLWLIEQASYEPHNIRYHSSMIEIGRGQVPTSYRKLKSIFRWGNDRVRTFLNLLEKNQMILKKTGTGFLIITICNYDKYQGESKKPGTPTGTNPGTQSGTRPGTNIIKGINKGKERKRNNICALEGFEEFWEVYAYKRGRDNAEKVWKQKGLSKIRDEVIAGAMRYVETRGDDPKYWKYPQGWLSAGRWRDEEPRIESASEKYLRELQQGAIQ